MHFANLGAWAKISDKGLELHCMPLYSILLSVKRTTVDFFSLDIEGNELDVLRTLPFDKVDIKVRKKQQNGYSGYYFNIKHLLSLFKKRLWLLSTPI